MRPLYRRGHMDQVLLTFGFTFVFFDLVQTVWGAVVLRLPAPEVLQGTVQIGAGRVLGVPAVPDRLRLCHRAAALAVSRAQPHRRHGARRRRRCRDGRRASASTSRRCSAASSDSASRSRRSAASRRGRCSASIPGMDTEILIPAFIVIVIGGMGSLRGAFVGSLLIGIADTFGKAYLPEPRAVPDLSGDDPRAADPAAGPVRHQILRRRRSHRPSPPRARRPRCRRAPPGWCALLVLLAAAVRDVGLPAGACRRDFHLRDLRHEPRPAARLHRPDVARPRRVFRTRRLCGRRARRACSASTPGSGSSPASLWRGCGAALIGFFCVRTGGIPFLMLTLAFSQLVFSVALKWRDVTGGSDGHGDRREAELLRLRPVQFARRCISWR